MESLDLLGVFQGLATLWASEPQVMLMRLFLMALGMALIYLGYRGVHLNPLTSHNDGGIDLKKIAPKARVY